VSLSPTDKKNLRAQIARFCLVAEKYRDRWTYSQVRPYPGLGHAPSAYHTDDCSAYGALIYYWAGHMIGKGVADPLGEHYSGWGNTETAHAFLSAHHAPPDKYRVGDIALYLEDAFQHHHMTICRTGGTGDSAWFSSNGSQADPNPTRLHYRSDLTGVYRHPALL